MKPTKIRRGIESRHARDAGSAPNLGRVSRLRDPEGPLVVRWTRKRGGRNKESPDAIKAHRRLVLVWSLGLTVVTLLVIGGFMMFWLRGHGKTTRNAEALKPLENVRIASKFESPSETEALDLVKRALAIRDVKEVETCFRVGGAQPAEVVEFISGSEARDGKLERLEWLSSMDVEGLLIEGVVAVYKGRDNPVERLALLVPDDQGTWKLDFDAFARSSRPSWAELLKGNADHAQVRVFVARDSYFNGPFLDESRWVCFAMVSPETKSLVPEEHELLRGYCKAGSPQAKAMERLFESGARMARATLEIRKVEGADIRQFEIARVLSEDWVLPPKPFDEKFD
jgi:hypothetical protein